MREQYSKSGRDAHCAGGCVTPEQHPRCWTEFELQCRTKKTRLRKRENILGPQMLMNEEKTYGQELFLAQQRAWLIP